MCATTSFRRQHYQCSLFLTSLLAANWIEGVFYRISRLFEFGAVFNDGVCMVNVIVSNINRQVEWWNLEPFIGSVCLFICYGLIRTFYWKYLAVGADVFAVSTLLQHYYYCSARWSFRIHFIVIQSKTTVLFCLVTDWYILYYQKEYDFILTW